MAKAKVDFSSNDSPVLKELHGWWQSLEQNRGARAELRRARGVIEVVMIPDFYSAGRRFAKFFPKQPDKLRLAMILGLLAHVEQRSSVELARQMATGDRPPVSELRFKRLLRCERDELYQPLVRVIRLLDRQINIGNLARLCFYWGDNIRRELAFNYYPHIKGA